MSIAPVVIKIGGAGLNDSALLERLLLAVKAIKKERSCVLVHGGGSLIDNWLTTWSRPVLKEHGMRITLDEDMPLIAGALSGAINSQLAAAANQAGLRAVGSSLLDANWCALTQDHTRGAVGIPVPENSNPDYLQLLLNNGLTPVISSIGQGDQGQLLNVNADLAAATVAAVLKADLLLLTDVPAIMTADGESLHTINSELAAQLIADNTVHGGMRVKLEAALQAARLSRRTTAVAGWDQPEQLAAVLQGLSYGTRILVS
ncbi:acetylglutamate kinase [Aliidiomarina minuta]|uniref:Acetylglutamate kinase n=1 Tax=Aliidiomarina minuta TaxID=880057 RepID=A0A432W6F1_9GAMM|nr:acetylglutamate kinase [Aliidiomarina minuta]RUO25653.1 acetylglutamate kinase [Aliidiomarina minuta]